MRCSKCGAENPDSKRFCGDCGAALLTADEAPASHPAVSGALSPIPGAELPEGERKTVTALFADLKGSTELMEALDPEEARAIVDPALRIMVDAVRGYEGYVVQSTGDGIFALFGAPAAYEDHPQRALYAALQMQQGLREYGQRRTAQGQAVLEARIGINTGEVVVRSVETGGKIEYTPIGHTANLASRLQTVAPAGSIAVSEYTRNLCEGYFELRALGPMAVRGISEAINVYEVTGLGPLRTHFELSARRGLTKFVGRENELEQLLRALEQAKDGHGQIVAVMAEAGTGKSRLFHEFKAKLPSPCKVLEAYSVSHGKASAWLPVLELLRDYFGFADADDAAARREKVRAALAALDAALGTATPYMFGLLGIVDGPDPLAQMDPEIKRQRTLDAIKRIVLRESLNQPVVVIFEDLHWIDSQTQALLDLHADSIATAQVLLLVNYRPEYSDQWHGKTYYSQIRLEPLGGADGEAMLSALLGEGVELMPLKRLVIERTGGNPFFIEEIVHALFDEGALVRNGAVKVTHSLSQLRLPPTVQGILASRIDRQPSDHKQLLQTLAVMGRESLLGLIREVASTAEPQLERMLADLQAGEFIYEQPASVEVKYTFKHVLTREVAYDSVLIERRKAIHERIAQAIEVRFGSALDDHLSELAYHYQRSDNVAKAVYYLRLASEQALKRSAFTEAIAWAEAALILLDRFPDDGHKLGAELALQLVVGRAARATIGATAGQVEKALLRAEVICRQTGNLAEMFAVVGGLHTFYLVRGEHQRARELAGQLLEMGLMEMALSVDAYLAVGVSLYWQGRFPDALANLQQGIARYRPGQALANISVVDSLAFSLAFAAMSLWQLGYADQALEMAAKALERARSLNSPYSIAMVRQATCKVRLFQRDSAMAEAGAEVLIAFSTEHGFSFRRAFGVAFRSWALVQRGAAVEALPVLLESIELWQKTGAKLWLPGILAALAEAYGEMADPERGLNVVADTLAQVDDTFECEMEAELYRLRGELLLKQDPSNASEAQNCFQRAIDIARKQSAKSWELRATMSLARLLAKQDRRDEARTMLAEIYNWFTEGFDTADLKDAKVLLDQFGA
jgi:class 3 adenylate cyclase/tetratricopeptide (TPR) repeat protein